MPLTDADANRVQAMEDAIEALKVAARRLAEVDPRDMAEVTAKLAALPADAAADPLGCLAVSLELVSDAVAPICHCRTPLDGRDDDLCPRHDGTPEEHAAGQAELRAWLATTGKPKRA